MKRKTYKLLEDLYTLLLEEELDSKITWGFCHKLLDATILDKIEAYYKFKIPNDLKNTIIKYNAGSPNKNIFDKPTKGKVFSGLLSFNKNDDDNVYDMIKSIHGNKKLVILPFGSDGFGNAICVTKTGSIVFWDHEQNIVTLIATSFNQFMAMLHK